MTHIDEQLEEERMIRLLREATRDIVAPVDVIVREGIRRGTSMRRKRRAARLAGICVCTVIVVGGVALVRPILAPPGASDEATVATQPATSSTAPSKSDSAGSRFAVATADMATTLAALLPGSGSVQQLRTWGSDATGASDGPSLYIANGDRELQSMVIGEGTNFRAGSLVYDDGRGLAAISVIVEEAAPGDRNAAAEDTEALCTQGATCTTTAHGRLVVLAEVSQAARGGAEGVVGTTAILLTDAGYSITATAYNAASEKESDPTRPSPPFTGEELGSVVTDSAWLS